MTMYEEREDFAAVLHETADGIETPRPEALYGGAVRRGRQIRRRRTLGTGAAAVVAVAAAGALAAALTGGAPGGGHAVASAATTGVRASGAPSPSASATASGTGQAILHLLLDALPKSADVLQNAEGGVQPQAHGPFVNDSGDWYVEADVSLSSTGSSGSSAVSVNAQRGTSIEDCAEAEKAGGWPTDTCRIESAGGGTLIVDESAKDPSAGEDNPIWNYTWNSPSGYEVNLTIGDSSLAAFALTQQQIVKVLTDPSWRTATAQLPEPVCPGGSMTQVASPGGAFGAPGIALKCSTTGKVYTN
jgi:hypothetical protein